jgi:hypothetical protein
VHVDSAYTVLSCRAVVNDCDQVHHQIVEVPLKWLLEDVGDRLYTLICIESYLSRKPQCHGSQNPKK